MSVIVAEPPLAIAPRLQVTVAPPVHDPCVVVAESNVVPRGTASETVTPWASDGPPFATVIV